jgi:aspartyl-tRNA(Asn)/glutamyl-tRNA(Gln) amidotransferase subunit C
VDDIKVGRKPANDMKVTDKDVAYVAELANLELTAEERARMAGDLNSILGHIEMLNELDTSKVEPMSQVALQSKPGAMREDALEGLRKSLPHQLVLANAPDSDGKFFEVPKVIER